MNFIKKIFDGKEDELVHLQFQKFSRGEFRDRAIIEVKKMKDKYSIKTSAEFGNELVKIVAEKLGEDKARVTGAIVATSDLTGRVEFKDKKQFQGVKRYLIDNKMSGNDLLNLFDEIPKAFFGLSFIYEDNQLKIKAKAPKSGKPGKGDEKVKADFCSLKTKDKKIIESFIFEKEDFNEAKINHTFIIEEIVAPEGEKDFAKIREFAKRKGKIIRVAEIDGKEYKNEKNFLV